MRRLRLPMLWLALLRVAVGIAAAIMAPWLFRDHFVLLVLLRPTKEVVLAGGFLVRRGDVNLGVLLLATIPLAILAVWHFWWLGRAWRAEIQAGGKKLPKLARRLLPPNRIDALCKVLNRKGARLVVLGRLAAFPSALLGAAAGVSDMPARRFLAADLLGGLLSIVEVVTVGYLLGEAYESAGPWLTAVGVVVLAVLLVLFGRYLAREEDG